MKVKKTSSKKVIAILLIIIGLAGTVLGALGLAGGRGKKDPYDVRNSVVMIYSYVQLTDGQAAAGMGTGFAIGTPGKPVEYIVTNGHVVEYGYAIPRQRNDVARAGVQVYYSAAENDYVSAEVVYYSPSYEKDVAILKLPSATDKREAVAIKDADKVKIGDTAYALGYPGVASSSQQFNTYDKDDITLTKGIVSKRTKPAWSDYDAFQMDVYINHGNSGGPLVDEQGLLIGINSSGAVDEQGKLEGVNFAITSAEIVRILDDQRVQYTMAGGGIAWAQSWFGYVFLPIGILAVIGGVLLLVTMKKNVQSAPSGTKASGSEKGVQRGGSGEKSAVLRGVTGRYAGQSFDLLKGKIVIGRDPATCNIVFDKNTPGISGRHCQVVYDPNEDCFIITDLGSSYGTFLGNGKKLTANVEQKLYAGDIFYLCDSSNRFVVTKE